MAGYFENSISAGAAWEINTVGRFMRLMSAGGLVSVEFYRNGSMQAHVAGVAAGFWRRGEFDRIILRNLAAGANTVSVVTDDDEIGLDSVSVTGQAGAYAQTRKTVTTASTSLAAANAARRYLLVQNKGAGNVYLNLAGAAATVGNGIKVEPGGSYESAAYAPTGEVFAIGDIASNPDIIVVEG